MVRSLSIVRRLSTRPATTADGTGLWRRSVFGRLAGCEDVNDAQRLSRDSAMRTYPATAFATMRFALQLHARAYDLADFMRNVEVAEGGGALVADHATGLTGNGGQG